MMVIHFVCFLTFIRGLRVHPWEEPIQTNYRPLTTPRHVASQFEPTNFLSSLIIFQPLIVTIPTHFQMRTTTNLHLPSQKIWRPTHPILVV